MSMPIYLIPVVACQPGREEIFGRVVIYWPLAGNGRNIRAVTEGTLHFLFVLPVFVSFLIKTWRKNSNTKDGGSLPCCYQSCSLHRWGHFLSTSCSQVAPSWGRQRLTDVCICIIGGDWAVLCHRQTSGKAVYAQSAILFPFLFLPLFFILLILHSCHIRNKQNDLYYKQMTYRT